MKWNKNTEELVRNANKRMRLLHAASRFTPKISDLKTIYKMFIRSSLEISSVVWHSGLVEKNRADLERVQKSAVKLILNERDLKYEDALKKLKGGSKVRVLGQGGACNSVPCGPNDLKFCMQGAFVCYY